MNFEFQDFLSKLHASEEDQQKLLQKSITNIEMLVLMDPGDLGIEDERLIEVVKKLNDNCANIVYASDSYKMARLTLNNGVYKETTKEISIDGKVLEKEEHSEGAMLNNSIQIKVENAVLTEMDISEIIKWGQKPSLHPGSLIINGREFSTRDFQFPGDVKLDDVSVNASRDEGDLDPNDYYKVDTRGRMLFINICSFDHCSLDRDEARTDSKLLPPFFENLGFDVEMASKDADFDEINEMLDKFSTDGRNASASMILVFIGSHGSMLNGKDYFKSSDNQNIQFDSVWRRFVDHEHLNGKPKIFLNQFCRSSGTLREGGTVQERADIPHQECIDMLFSFSTEVGNLSYRERRSGTTGGTWYTTAIRDIFQRYAGSEDLMSMLTRVNGIVTSRHEQAVSQLCVARNYLRKKVQFRPTIS